MTKINLEGQVFNRLLVLKEVEPKNGRIYWDCICVCGNKKTVSTLSLRCGQVQSCGCLRNERFLKAITKHGFTKTSEYYTWVNMKTRCYNVKVADPNYIGRGITVCDRWLNSFENFLEDMGKKPSRYHSIDRIDNNKGYSPDNCRWATLEVQANNKRNVVYYEHNGIRKTLQGWSNYFGVHQANLMNTLKTRGIASAYDFYYKKHNGLFPDGGKVKNKKKPNYNLKKPLIGYKEGMSIVFESKSMREMSRITGLHHSIIENFVYNNIKYKDWYFELINI